MKIVYPILGNPIFPIVFPTDHSLTSTPVFYIFYCIECIIVVLNIPLLIRFLRDLDKSALFHRNLIIIIQCHYIALYIAQLVRLILIFYGMGIISVSEEILLPSVFTSLCHANLFFKCSSISTFLSILIERLLASYFIDDYEAKARIWVAITALLSSCLLTACYSTPTIYNIVGMHKMLLFSMTVSTLFSIAIVALYKRDRRRLNGFIMRNSRGYELSTRFQLVENLRVLKLLMKASIAFSIWIICPCVILLPVYLYFLPSTLSGQILFASFELFVSL
ncbi:hypothetical protein GCK32_017537 [Trichostrongylus colubriformis]|uniref:G protein-coupled receptor n=1 Tax=Trichostrongylus colubriformis TaxID=6319 RepID=A0AAN8G7A4_TRICO